MRPRTPPPTTGRLRPGPPRAAAARRVLGVVFPLALAVAACSGSGDEEATTAPPDGPAPSQDAPAPSVDGNAPTAPAAPAAGAVVAAAETEPVAHEEDAADDPAIWVHPSDPAASAVVGTDKEGALEVYDLAGRRLQSVPGSFNNVDLRDDLVVAGDGEAGEVVVFRMDPARRELRRVAGFAAEEPHGLCAYRDAPTGRTYVFSLPADEGTVEQWELGADGTSARRVRTLAVGGEAEGCVADDGLGHLYVGEEERGIWKYGAAPDASPERVLVGAAGSDHLTADVEGLALAETGDGTGYLVASSQGDSSFAVYRREGDNAFVRSFRIEAGPAADEVTETDGIAATTRALGPAFPDGLFVAQDDANDDGNQNFKLVPWPAVVGER